MVRSRSCHRPARRRRSSGSTRSRLRLDERGMKGDGGRSKSSSHLAQEQWLPLKRGARRGQGLGRSRVPQAPARQRPRRGRRARPRDAEASPPPRGAGEHADGAERHLLHAVLVHGLHDHRAAAGLVQGPRVPLARRARVAHRAEGDGPRPAAGGRDPRVGHHGGHALHGAARAAAGNRRLAGGEARRHRHARCA